MTPPGTRLREIASRLCTARTMERLIDPMLADMQAEYREARANGQLWTSRRIRAAGYVSFVKAIGLYGVHQVLQATQHWPADDRQALGRAIRVSAAAFLAVTVLLLLPVLYASPGQMRIVLFQ